MAVLCDHSHSSPFFQSDRFQAGLPAGFYRSKSQTSSIFSPLSSFTTVQKQRPEADQLLATQAQGNLLLAALKQYLSVGVKTEGQEDPVSRLWPFYSNRMENSEFKKETMKSRPLKTGRTEVLSVKDLLTSVDGT